MEDDPIKKFAQEQIEENEKYPKSVAKYRPAEKEDEQCKLCEYFVSENGVTGCEKVGGEIDPHYVCNLFEEADDEQAEAEGADEADEQSEESEQ